MATASVSPKAAGTEPVALFCGGCGYMPSHTHHAGRLCEECARDYAYATTEPEGIDVMASLSDEEKAALFAEETISF